MTAALASTAAGLSENAAQRCCKSIRNFAGPPTREDRAARLARACGSDSNVQREDEAGQKSRCRRDGTQPVMSAMRRSTAVMPAIVLLGTAGDLPPSADAACASSRNQSARTLAFSVRLHGGGRLFHRGGGFLRQGRLHFIPYDARGPRCRSKSRERVIEHAVEVLFADVVDDRERVSLQLIQRLEYIAEVVVTRDLQIDGQGRPQQYASRSRASRATGAATWPASKRHDTRLTALATPNAIQNGARRRALPAARPVAASASGVSA